jgi:hypothetical protein
MGCRDRGGPASSAGRAACGRAPGSGFSRPPTAPPDALADRPPGPALGSGLWPARGQAARPTTSFSLSANFGSLESSNWRTRCGARPWLCQMCCTEETLMPVALAIAAAVQWVASPGGSPACMDRSCQRQTTDLLLPICRMIAVAPSRPRKPSPLSDASALSATACPPGSAPGGRGRDLHRFRLHHGRAGVRRRVIQPLHLIGCMAGFRWPRYIPARQYKRSRAGNRT